MSEFERFMEARRKGEPKEERPWRVLSMEFSMEDESEAVRLYELLSSVMRGSAEITSVDRYAKRLRIIFRGRELI